MVILFLIISIISVGTEDNERAKEYFSKLPEHCQKPFLALEWTVSDWSWDWRGIFYKDACIYLKSLEQPDNKSWNITSIVSYLSAVLHL